MKGTLEGFSLQEIFQSIGFLRKSGTLSLFGDEKEVKVCFGEGEIVSAISSWEEETGDSINLNDNPSLQSKEEECRYRDHKDHVKELIWEILEWPEAGFSFFSEAISKEKDLGFHLKTEDIFAEIEEDQKEWQKIKKVIPSLEAKVEVVPVPPQGKITLNVGEWRILYFLKETLSVRELKNLTKLSTFSLCSALLELVNSGLVKISLLSSSKEDEKKEDEVKIRKYIKKAIENLAVGERQAPLMPMEWASYYQRLNKDKRRDSRG